MSWGLRESTKEDTGSGNSSEAEVAGASADPVLGEAKPGHPVGLPGWLMHVVAVTADQEGSRQQW